MLLFPFLLVLFSMLESIGSENTCKLANRGTSEMKIIFLHHSTGGNIWNGGVPEWFKQYDSKQGVNYQITEQPFPKGDPYAWKNYPYDYWNIWVDHAGNEPFMEEPTLEILTKQYQVIIFKHCFPVSGIEADTGNPNIASEDKRIENYKLQYNALKAKMHEFPNTKFIVWTGAGLVRNNTNEEQGIRTRKFFDWVKKEWDERGDNIFIWDFYELETEGGLYLKDEYAASPDDSHPNEPFAKKVAPLFCQRIVDVVEGRGDNSSIMGYTGIMEDDKRRNLPENPYLFQNNPNPFNAETVIQYDLSGKCHAILRISDISGREIVTLVNEEQAPGSYFIHWDGTGQNGQQLASGVYFYELNAGNFVKSRKMTLIK